MSNENPEIELEAALRLAATEAAHRPEFYQKLLNAEAYVLGDSNEGKEGEYVATEGSTISIANWQTDDGKTIIPFFSSLQELEKSIDSEQSYVRLPVRTLFEMTKGSELVLNPRSSYGKQFLPDEIDSLLADGNNHKASSRVIEKETRVLLGQPQDYPHALVKSLSLLFSKHQNVNAAYVALMHAPDSNEEPTLVLGVRGGGDLQTVIKDAGSVAIDCLPAGKFLDIVQIDPSDTGVSAYFLQSSEPFYKRGVIGNLKAFFGRS